MPEVDFCSNNATISRIFSIPTMKIESSIRHFLTTLDDINVKDIEGNSLLHFAVTTNDKHILMLLLSAGAPINDSRIDGYTPLHLAIESGKEEIVQILLNSGASVSAKGLFGRTPLHVAAYASNQDKQKIIRIVKSILDIPTDLKSLLNLCTDSGETPLIYAIIHDSEGLVKLFLQYGANVNAKNRDGKTPLYFAIEFNNLKIANVLLLNGARVNDKMNNGFTALHEAIKQRAEKSVELLLNFGAETNAKDIYGKTPLHLAARLNYLDERTMDKIVKLLLSKEADVNDYTNSGETAFHCAIISGNERLVRLFLEYGANVNIKNYDGKSPLHFAIQYSNKNIVKLLLERGADIDDRTSDGKLALHVAVAVEDENMIKILLESNADVNAIDKSGKTPLSLAFEVAHMRSIYNPWNGFCPIHTEFGRDDNIFEILIKHIAKMTYVCEENLKMISNNEKLNTFYKECQKELEKMKAKIVCDNISMYKLLTKSVNVLVGYARNENLLRIFQSDLLTIDFPIYYYMIKERFCKAEHKKNLLEPSAVILGSLSKPFSLPDLVTNKILSYMTLEDLSNLKRV